MSNIKAEYEAAKRAYEIAYKDDSIGKEEYDRAMLAYQAAMRRYHDSLFGEDWRIANITPAREDS